MKAKLTLCMEQLVIEKAKKYASKNEQSLSGLIENYLKTLINEEIPTEEELSPNVKALRGAFKTPKNFDYKKELRNQLSDKFIGSNNT